MRHPILSLFAALSLLVMACGKPASEDPKGKVSADTVAKPSLPVHETGVVVTREAIAGDPSGSYAYYLPKSYSPSQPLPLLIFFDSHARGKDPVKLYKDLAEQYGLILVGSNVSKNGQGTEQGPAIYDKLITDVRSKFAVNDKHIFTSGFSGGARVAATVTQVRGLAGSIGCAAGFQLRDVDHWPYYGIVGVWDFNYWEMYQLEERIQQPSVIRWWQGDHRWPPAEVMSDGIRFLLLRTLDASDARRDSLAEACRAAIAKEDPSLHGRGAVHGSWRLQKALVSTLDGVVDVTADKAKLAQLANAAGVQNAPQEMQAAQVAEMEVRNEYAGYLDNTPAEWQQLCNQLRAGKKPYVGRDHGSDMRVLGYASLIAYMQCDGALANYEHDRAERLIANYAIVDPTNSEHAYMTAKLRMRQGRRPEALAALKKAGSLGFKEPDRMAIEPDFAPLLGDPVFEEVLRQARGD